MRFLYSCMIIYVDTCMADLSIGWAYERTGTTHTSMRLFWMMIIISLSYTYSRKHTHTHIFRVSLHQTKASTLDQFSVPTQFLNIVAGGVRFFAKNFLNKNPQVFDIAA